MKYKFFILIAMLLGVVSAGAVTAKPGLIEVCQPDGSWITIRMDGGPRGHNIYNVDDEILRVDERGYYVQADDTFKERVSGRRLAKRKADGLRSNPFPTTGTQKALVVLVQFPDRNFTIPNPTEHYKEMLNGTDYTAYDATGSVRQYYLDNSGGLFDITFDVVGPVTLDKESTYYGENDYWGDDKQAHEMILDACDKLYNEEGFDFSPYDENNDGVIDNVYVFYAGYGEADGGGPATVWPHSWDLEELGIKRYYGELLLNHYACSMELQYYPDQSIHPDGIGTFCHEFCHVMGLPDIYSSIGGGAFTPSRWDLLDSGSYNNDSHTPPYLSGYERFAFGWIEPVELQLYEQASLRPIGESNKVYIIHTDNDDEYFILENRQHTAWDSYIPHHGMLVWHIDYNEEVWDNNTVNINAGHQYIDIVEADGIPSNWTRDGDVFPGAYEKTEITSATNPALVSWSGIPISFDIKDITEHPDGTITFNTVPPGTPTGIEERTSQDTSDVRYFNLLGVEIANPGKGQILIEKRGNVAKKIIY